MVNFRLRKLQERYLHSFKNKNNKKNRKRSKGVSLGEKRKVQLSFR